MSIGVVIADDQGLVRGGLRVLVEMTDDMTVLGEAADGTEAVALARQHHPDVILMDIRMPHQDGIEATRQIKQDDDTAQTKVLVLTTFDLDEYVYAALRPRERIPPQRHIPRKTPRRHQDHSRRRGASCPHSHPTSHREFRRPRRNRPGHPRPAHVLTDREREVLREVAKGHSNTEIANRLHISAATAKTHMSRLLMKLDARDRAQLVVIAYETRLAKPGPLG